MEDEVVSNRFILSQSFIKSDEDKITLREFEVDSEYSANFGLPLGDKVRLKILNFPEYTLPFEGGGKIVFEPHEIIIFDDGTFKTTRRFQSDLYTRFQRPRYNARMNLVFSMLYRSTVLDTHGVRFYVSCRENLKVYSGSYDPKYFDLIDQVSIAHNGTAYDC